MAIPFVPTAKVNIAKGFFASAGVGYLFLHASANGTFDGFHVSGSKNFNGWTANVAGGYDIWINNRVSFSPQIGIDYARVSGSNFIIPNIRLNVNYHF